jgi:hypothetical protein
MVMSAHICSKLKRCAIKILIKSPSSALCPPQQHLRCAVPRRRKYFAMSASNRSHRWNRIGGGPTGSFENGVFIPHRDSAATEEKTSSTTTTESKERSATPEWYDNPTSLDHLNPTGVRTGASYPALQTLGGKCSRGRDSIDEGDDEKTDTPRKRRRISPPQWFKAGVRRLWPIRPAPRPRRLPLSGPQTQSETALGQYPLEVEVDSDNSILAYWEMTEYLYTWVPVTPARPRTVSSPPVLPDRHSARMHWWAPSGYQVRSPTWRQNEGSDPDSEQDDMPESVSPVTRVPASPRLEGESKDDAHFLQIDALVI